MAITVTLLTAACGGNSNDDNPTAAPSSSGPLEKAPVESGTQDSTSSASGHALQSKALSPRMVQVRPRGVAATTTDYQRLYGPGVFHMNALGNTLIGSYNGYNRMISNRFMATSSGNLDYIKLLFATGNNYSRGTGGTLRITIRPDDGSGNNLPDMSTVLATAFYSPNLSSHPKRTFPRDIHFQSSPWLQAGRVYHVLIENTDSNSAANYISVDHAVTHADNGRPSRWLNTRDWATLMATREGS